MEKTKEEIAKDEIILDQQREIAALKKKLEDRNPAFNGNLLKRSDQKFNDLSKSMGEAIKNAIGQDLVHIVSNKKMHLYFESSMYGSSHWRVWFNAEDEKKIKDRIADLEMERFQQSLDNFSWAINNGQG